MGDLRLAFSIVFPSAPDGLSHLEDQRMESTPPSSAPHCPVEKGSQRLGAFLGNAPTLVFLLIGRIPHVGGDNDTDNYDVPCGFHGTHQHRILPASWLPFFIPQDTSQVVFLWGWIT